MTFVSQPQFSPMTSGPLALPCTYDVQAIRLGDADRILIDEVDYKLLSSTNIGHVLHRVDNPGVVEEFTHEQLDDLMNEGRLVIRRRYDDAGAAIARLKANGAFLSDLPDDGQSQIITYADAFHFFLRGEAQGLYSRSDAGIKRFTRAFRLHEMELETERAGQKVSNTKLGSPSTIRRRLRLFEACGYDPRSLIKAYGRGGSRAPKISANADALLRKHARRYLSSNKPSMAKIWRDMRDEFKVELPDEPVPGRSALERRIQALDKFKTMAAREGESAARKQFYHHREHFGASRPLEIVMIDEADLNIKGFLEEQYVWEQLHPKLKEGITHRRFKIGKAMDLYSRAVLATVVISSSSTESALATLRMIMEDKAALAQSLGCRSAWPMSGRPELILVDSGMNYRSNAFRAACLDAQIAVMIAPAGVPQLRGALERSFRTDNTQFVKEIPGGMTFESVDEKGDYITEESIAATIDELAQLYVRWIVDVYHNTPHAGLGGDTPINVFRKGVRQWGIIPPPSQHELRHICSVKRKQKLGKSGVRVLGLNYTSSELHAHFRRYGGIDVEVRVDTRNLGAVSVRFPDGYRTVPCMIEGFEGIDARSWQLCQERLRRDNAVIAAMSSGIVAAAMRDIRAEAETMIERQKIARRRLIDPIMSADDFNRLDEDLSRFQIADPDDSYDLLGLPIDAFDGETDADQDAVIAEGGTEDDFFEE
ncbi:MAG: hypothetical protein ABS75_25915 [Pelagibacterium sp. SCN 63-23]|nr:MAG: hypothetical protein ABS75_25915 [Pelagibacterium sp. SCN 63-23]